MEHEELFTVGCYSVVETEREIRVETASDVICRMGYRTGDKVDDETERAAQIEDAKVIVAALHAAHTLETAS